MSLRSQLIFKASIPTPLAHLFLSISWEIKLDSMADRQHFHNSRRSGWAAKPHGAETLLKESKIVQFIDTHI